MRAIVLALLLSLVPIVADAQRNCVKGKPCGNTCIARDKTCRIGTAPPGSGATGERPAIQRAPEYERVGGQGSIHFIALRSDVVGKRSVYYRAVEDVCPSEARICIVMFWPRIADIPTSLPMTDVQVAGKVAAYNINRSTGLDGFTCHPFGPSGERCAP